MRGIGPRLSERFSRKELWGHRGLPEAMVIVELRLTCGFLTAKTYSLFTELLSEGKGPSSGHFRVSKKLARGVCRSFQKYPHL